MVGLFLACPTGKMVAKKEEGLERKSRIFNLVGKCTSGLLVSTSARPVASLIRLCVQSSLLFIDESNRIRAFLEEYLISQPRFGVEIV